MIKIDEKAKEKLMLTLDPPLVGVLGLHHWSIFCPPDSVATDQYEHSRRGKCMLCGEDLGEDSVIITDAQGILGIWCSGECLIDTHAISFLEGLLVDMVDNIGRKGKYDADKDQPGED